MRFISLDAQGTYTATVCGVEIPVMVDSHICTWVEAHAAEMCKDPNVNLGFDECRIWIYQNWVNGSVKAGPEVQTLRQLLPSAEIGTAHMENPMGIRKTIASGLIIAANAVTKDRTKENIAAEVKVLRRKLARFIEPKGGSV